MRIVWCTDIHLNFLNKVQRQQFYYKVRKAKPDLVIISGDIGESDSTEKLIIEFTAYIEKPTYYILGNHDYYGSSISDVRTSIPLIHDCGKTYASYISQRDDLTPWGSIGLVGCDGWGDGQNGKFFGRWGQQIWLNDSNYIEDLNPRLNHVDNNNLSSREWLYKRMLKLAKADKLILQKQLNKVLKQEVKTIIVVTHVPPWKQAALYLGHPCDENFLPFYSNKTLGDYLKYKAKKHEDIKFIVLCGHSHCKAEYQVTPNMICKTGASEYTRPQIAEIIEI